MPCWDASHLFAYIHAFVLCTLQERNALDVSVYEFAREMQALDVMLWSFMQVCVLHVSVGVGGGETGGGGAACVTHMWMRGTRVCWVGPWWECTAGNDRMARVCLRTTSNSCFRVWASWYA